MLYSETETAEQNLSEISRKFPGNALELRVPGAGVINILQGVNHRRGNPANVVEIELIFFNKLCERKAKFNEGIQSGAIRASGALSDIAFIFENL